MNPHQEEILLHIKLIVHSVSNPINIKDLSKLMKISYPTTDKYVHVSEARGDIRIEKVGPCKILLKP